MLRKISALQAQPATEDLDAALESFVFRDHTQDLQRQINKWNTLLNRVIEAIRPPSALPGTTDLQKRLDLILKLPTYVDNPREYLSSRKLDFAKMPYQYQYKSGDILKGINTASRTTATFIGKSKTFVTQPRQWSSAEQMKRALKSSLGFGFGDRYFEYDTDEGFKALADDHRSIFDSWFMNNYKPSYIADILSMHQTSYKTIHDTQNYMQSVLNHTVSLVQANIRKAKNNVISINTLKRQSYGPMRICTMMPKYLHEITTYHHLGTHIALVMIDTLEGGH